MGRVVRVRQWERRRSTAIPGVANSQCPSMVSGCKDGGSHAAVRTSGGLACSRGGYTSSSASTAWSGGASIAWQCGVQTVSGGLPLFPVDVPDGGSTCPPVDRAHRIAQSHAVECKCPTDVAASSSSSCPIVRLRCLFVGGDALGGAPDEESKKNKAGRDQQVRAHDNA